MKACPFLQRGRSGPGGELWTVAAPWGWRALTGHRGQDAVPEDDRPGGCPHWPAGRVSVHGKKAGMCRVRSQ